MKKIITFLLVLITISICFSQKVTNRQFSDFLNLFDKTNFPVITKKIIISNSKEIPQNLALKFFVIKNTKAIEYNTYNYDEEGKKHLYLHQIEFYALYKFEIGDKYILLHAEKKADSLFIYSSIFKDSILMYKLSIHGTKGQYNNWASTINNDSIIHLYSYNLNWNSFYKDAKSGGYHLKKDSLYQTEINLFDYKMNDLQKNGNKKFYKGKYSSSEYYYRIKKDDPYYLMLE